MLFSLLTHRQNAKNCEKISSALPAVTSSRLPFFFKEKKRPLVSIIVCEIAKHVYINQFSGNDLQINTQGKNDGTIGPYETVMYMYMAGLKESEINSMAIDILQPTAKRRHRLKCDFASHCLINFYGKRLHQLLLKH